MKTKINVKFEDGKTIIDGIPNVLYINEKGLGIGQLYIKGEQERGIREINIHAECIESCFSPLILRTERMILNENQ